MATRPRLLVLALLAVGLTGGVAAAQQPTLITGRVTSDAGAPLGSASVFISELSVGSLTRPDGTYSLTIPAGRISAGQTVQLTAQTVGYRSQTQAVTLTPGQTASVNFQLPTDVLELEGIVATGIGLTTTRERLGVSISSVSGEQLTQVQSPNVVAALAAKAPSVEITSTSGEPGASAYIRIRGINTLNTGTHNGQPLFVVDGVPVDNSENLAFGADPFARLRGAVPNNRAADINAQDIESVEILKGAAAAAIYGARAANGVVLITTRSGRPGVTRVALTTTATVDEVTRGIPLQRRFGQGNQGIAPDGTPGNTPNDRIQSWGPELPGGTATYDHWDELFRTGNQFDSNLSISGGSDRTTYYLSVGRLDHTGVIVGPNNWYERTSARLKAAHRLTDQLNVSGNFAYVETGGAFVQRGSTTSGLLLGALRTPPEFDNREYLTGADAPLPGLHRSYRNPNPTAVNQGRGFDNPFFVLHEQQNTQESGRAYGHISVEYSPLRDVSLAYTLGNDYTGEQRVNVWPMMSTTRPTGRMTRGQYTTQQVDHNLVASASRDLTEQVGASLAVGWNRNIRRFDQLEFQGDDFVAPGVYVLNNTVTRFPFELKQRIHAESFFGQAQLDLYDQLFVTGALRNDGFSTFGASEKRHWYPKASAAWDFTRTLGMQGNPYLSFGKLRAAWGQAGNEPPVYGTITVFTAAPVLDGGWTPALNPTYAGRGGLYASTVQGQENLRPERTREIEAGLDLSLLGDRVGLGLTYYDARTEDVIFNAQVAPSTGYFFQLQNAATIENKGVEASLTLRPIQTARFAWEAGLNFGTNDNRVVDLGDPDREFVNYTNATSFTGVSVAAVRGEKVGVFRGNDWYRCGRAGESLPDNIAAACQGAPAGALFIAENGFPVVDPRLRTIADPHPDWTAGIRNTFTLQGGLSISTLLDIKHGGQMWNGTRASLIAYGTHADTEDRDVQMTYAQRSGEPVVGPGREEVVTFGEDWYLGQGGGFGQNSAQFIEDAGYVKLREVAANYTLPSRLTQRMGLSGVDLRVAGRNLHTWTKYSGQDPETNLAGATNSRGYDFFNNPQVRSVIFTVGLTR